MNYIIYYIHFEITGYPCNVIGSQRCDLFPNCTIFCSKSHLFFSANENSTEKQNNQSNFKAFFKLTNHITGKERKNSLFNKFGNFCGENFINLKMDEFNYQYRPKSCSSCILAVKLCDFKMDQIKW